MQYESVDDLPRINALSSTLDVHRPWRELSNQLVWVAGDRPGRGNRADPRLSRFAPILEKTSPAKLGVSGFNERANFIMSIYAHIRDKVLE